MRSRSGCLWALCAWVLVGCATRAETINRVQPNALEKKLFTDGPWYTLATVIDADYYAPVPVGDASELSRVEFEIQQEYLIARRTHQFVRGSEGESISSESEPHRVVAMYAIDSHFDIRREYNPLTGEEQNVIVENSEDRPWYERDFFRVDWSKNLIESPSFSVTSGLGGVELTGLSYFEQDEGEPGGFAPRFERDELGRVSYFDVVNKYLAEPRSVPAYTNTGEAIDVAACLFLDQSYVDCAPGEVAVRQAFLRIEDRDYEAAVYTPDRMDKFGYFLQQRDGYDPEYGLTRDERDLFIRRHNLWRQSHRRDAFGARIACRTDADCDDGTGSHCDTTWARAHERSEGFCTLPFREREVRPIVYYTSLGYPQSLRPDAEKLARDWNRAFEDTVASLRAIECEANGEGTREECDETYSRKNTERVFVLCHNPVTADDPEACGEEGLRVEIGDIRYNLLGYVPEPHAVSPLGFGPSFADPLTGEIISAAAYVYGAALERSATQGRDALALLSGEINPAVLQDTTRLAGWRRSLRRGAKAAAHSGAQHVIDVDAKDVHEANADMGFDGIVGRALARMPEVSAPRSPEQRQAVFDAAKAAVGRAVENTGNAQRAEANRKALIGTVVEDMLIHDEVKLRAGVDPAEPLSDAQMDRHSPLRGGSLSAQAAVTQLQRKLNAERAHCVMDRGFVDNGLLGLVRDIDRAVREGDGTVRWYGEDYQVRGAGGEIDFDLVREMIKHPLYQAVASHEVGHTLGLRHNFSGSYDAMNYHPRYWKLRRDGDMRPRAWDPLSEREINRRIREYQYSSVMDYGHNFIVTDAEGIGHYDRAAIKMGYGDLVEVFTDVPPRHVAQVATMAQFASSGLFGRQDVRRFDFAFVPYTDFPSLVGGVNALEKRQDVPYTSLRRANVQFEVDGQPVALATILDEQARPPVPYVYCGDEFADFQTHCLRYDAGADEYESMQSIIDSYWNDYPFSHFQQQRLDFDVDQVVYRSYGRYLSKLEYANRIYSLYRSILQTSLEALDQDADAFFTAEDGLGAYTLGVRAAFDLLRRIVTVPEPGQYVLDSDELGNPAYVERGVGQGDLSIDGFDGRALRTGFDYGPDSSLLFLDRAGFFHDKALALQVLTYSNVTFIGQDTVADVRGFSTNFYTTFPDSVTELLRGLVSRDWQAHAPRLVSDGTLYYPTPREIEEQGLMTPGTPVSPNFAFSLELVAMLEGMRSIPRSFDQSYISKARVWVRGGAESVDVTGDDPQTVEYTDPSTGLTYVASSFPETRSTSDGEVTVETGVGASMILRAQRLEAAGETLALEDWIDNLDFMRFVSWELGFGNSGEGL